MATGNPIHLIGTQEHLDEAFEGMASNAAIDANSSAYSRKDYQVNIPAFEGPLDLLLHLIRKDQVNIHDIPIAQICQSYLEYIRLMEEPDVNLAGEFMVMAATLMYLKSIMLLLTDDEDEAEDPRKPLVAQLLEYEQFQKAAKELDSGSWLGRDLYARPAAASKDLIPAEAKLTCEVEPVEMYQLLVSLRIAMDRTSRPDIRVEVDAVSLRDKVFEIEGALEETDTVEITKFVTLTRESKKEVIITFLSILELARLGFIEIIQNENFGPIHLHRVRSLSELNVSLLNQF